MIDDYVHQNIYVEVAELQALEDISSILESLGKNINNYEIVLFNVNIDYDERLTRIIAEEKINFDIEESFDCSAMLNTEQQLACDIIMKK